MYDSLEQVTWTDAWFVAAAELPEATRRALLVEADAVRDRAHPLWAAASACYVALLPAPSGNDELDAERIRFAERNATAKDVHERAFYERLIATAGAADEADPHRIAWGICAAAMGDLEAARRAMGEVLDRHRGAGTRLELKALLNLATVLQLQDKLVSGLLLNRRAGRLARRLHLVEPRVVALANALPLLEDLGLDDDLERALDALAAALPAADPAMAPRYERHAFRFHASLAVRQGRLADAVSALDGLAELATRVPASGHGLAFEALTRISFFAAKGAVGAALKVSELALARDDVPLPCALALEAWRLRLLERQGLGSEARSSARAQLATFQTEVAAMAPEQASRTATMLLEAFERQGDEESARVAGDLAATTALEAVRRFEVEARAFPELLEPDPADLALLTRIRTRSMDRHRSRCAAVALHLERDLQDEGVWANTLRRPHGDSVLVCAWCQRYATAKGSWLPLAPYVAELREGAATHGLCETCYENVAKKREKRG